MARPRARKPKSAVKSVIELALTVVIAVGLALLIQAFIVKPYKIPSGSMEPTLHINQRILADRLIGNPGLGNIIVFHPPEGATPANGAGPVCGNSNQGGDGGPTAQACDKPTAQASSQTFIKRVVGLPGDTIKIIDGQVYRNGKLEKDTSMFPCAPDESTCNFPVPIKIPPGHYFMMGDNRGESDDSRFWGPVPDSWIIGQAVFTYWPPDRIGFF
jgi:signal peptidase I